MLIALRNGTKRSIFTLYKTIPLNHICIKHQSLFSVCVNHIPASSYSRRFFAVLNNDVITSLCKPNIEANVSSNQIRTKKTKSTKRPEYDSESSDDDEFDDEPKEFQKGTKILKIHVDSLRADVILKHGLGIPRNKLEVAFYKSQLRVNGKKVMKKNHIADIGDEVDLIKEVNAENPKLLNVSRIEILKAKPGEDNVVLTVRRYRNLLIENYEEDPWVEPVETEETEK